MAQPIPNFPKQPESIFPLILEDADRAFFNASFQVSQPCATSLPRPLIIPPSVGSSTVRSSTTRACTPRTGFASRGPRNL